MPRADGTLYNFEKDALVPKVEKVKQPKAIKETKQAAYVAEKKPAPTLDSVVAEVERRQIAKGGRPIGSGRLKATPEVIEKVLDGIRHHLTIEKSLILAGVERRSFERWRCANRSLQARFEQAETEAEKSLVSHIIKFAPSDWKAANWILERRHNWQQVSRNEVTGANGGPVLALTLSKQVLGAVAGQGDPEVKAAKAKRVGPVIDIPAK